MFNNLFVYILDFLFTLTLILHRTSCLSFPFCDETVRYFRLIIRSRVKRRSNAIVMVLFNFRKLERENKRP